MSVPSTDIQSTLNEKRLFVPPSDFSSHAHIKSLADYERLYKEADRDPETFWGNIARTRLGGTLDQGSRMERPEPIDLPALRRKNFVEVCDPVRGLAEDLDFSRNPSQARSLDL